MTQRDGHIEDASDQPPAGLVADLKTLSESGASVPPELDEAVLAAARERMGGLRRRRLVFRLATVTSAAAAIAFAVVLAGWDWRDAGTDQAVVMVAEDIDRSGRVDMLDAFALARRVEAGHPTDPQWDFNGDRVVDRRDVDVVATAAVRVPTG